ncbi:MAG: type II toxin-antitoxin system VapC family toxin [Thermodesulfobacteriota bacterium]|nr:type II toxin-antitoxin system VapC family toxin [Thermodesulfobacteriota bacterium]
MILLDTNVISEPLRRAPEARVINWIDAQSLETLYLSAITVAELRFGAANLPVGKRRDELQTSLENQILPLFSGRVRPFELDCTTAYAELMAKAKSAGLAIAAADGYIAAIAATNRFSVATRDVSPFQAAGVNVINPWDEYSRRPIRD